MPANTTIKLSVSAADQLRERAKADCDTIAVTSFALTSG
jgi:hypothetical protein